MQAWSLCTEFCGCLDCFCMSKWNISIDDDFEEGNENNDSLENGEI